MKHLSGKEKATILLSILGPQRSARLLRKLPDEVSELVAARVATLPPPTGEMVQVLLSELSGNLLTSSQSEIKSLAAAGSSEDILTSEQHVITEYTEVSQIPAAKLATVLKEEKVRIWKFVLTILEDKQAAELKKLLKVKDSEASVIDKYKEIPLCTSIEPLFKDYLISKVKALNDGSS